MFSAVDGQGNLSIFDLTSPDMEVPVVKHKVGDRALNRARWCPHHDPNKYPKKFPGYKIATGDSSGQVLVHDLNTHIGGPTSDKEAMWKGLREALTEMDDQRTSRQLTKEEESKTKKART